MNVPAFIVERANEARNYDKPYSFDCQFLDYIRWQDKTIEDMREEIHELERDIDELKRQVNSIRLRSTKIK